jgi:hypothetical protein
MIDALIAENTNEHDLFGGGRDDLLLFEPGTVGWDDADDHVDLGTADNDGATLIRVTLFRGRDPSVPLTPGVAQGHKVLAQLGGGFFRVPPKATRVMVGFPTAFATSPGACVIVCTLERSPVMQFSATKAKLDVGPDQDLVFKARSVTISDYDNRFLHVGPDGVMLQDEAGNAVVMMKGAILSFVADGGDAKSLLQITKDEVSLLQKTVGFLKLKGSSATLFSNKSACIVAGNIVLGPTPATALPALIGPPPGTPSKVVFLSP